MIIVTATLSFETEEDRDRAVASTAAVQKATRDDEPGCLAYCFAADPAEATHIQVYELWTAADALADHFEHPNYAAMVAYTDKLIGRVAESAVGVSSASALCFCRIVIPPPLPGVLL